MAFQMKFAIITPALISGAFVERMKFAPTWSSPSSGPRSSTTRSPTGSGRDGGWLAKLGVLDFAGGTVVHWTAGLSALVCALFIGKRVGYGQRASSSPTTCR